MVSLYEQVCIRNRAFLSPPLTCPTCPTCPSISLHQSHPPPRPPAPFVEQPVYPGEGGPRSAEPQFPPPRHSRPGLPCLPSQTRRSLPGPYRCRRARLGPRSRAVRVRWFAVRRPADHGGEFAQRTRRGCRPSRARGVCAGSA